MRSALSTVLLLATLCEVSLTQSSDYAQELSNALTNREVVLRHYYTDASLTFDTTGKVISASTEGFGPTDGRIYLQKVELTADQLALIGDRPVDFFDPIKKKRTIADMHRPVSVYIHLPVDELPSAAVPKLLSAIFLTQTELAGIRCQHSEQKGSSNELQLQPGPETAPNLPNAASLDEPHSRCVRHGERVYPIGGRVTAPKATYAPDPNYTDAARKAKIMGTTVLSVIVTPQGKTSAIAVVRSLAKGLDPTLLPSAFQLDEQAVNAVSRWTFEPAKLGDTPVPVIITVEVNFKLYR